MQTEQPSVSIVGLGSGRWESLTVQAAGVLEHAPEIFVKSTAHPSLVSLLEHVPNTTVHSFDDLYKELDTVAEVNGRIADTLADLALRSPGIVYAVPGSPTVGDAGVRLLIERLQAREIPYTIVQGLSAIEPVLQVMGVPGVTWLELFDAIELDLLSRENAVGEVPGDAERRPWRAPVPTAPALVTSLHNPRVASGVKKWLGKYYPDQHEVHLVHTQDSGLLASRALPLGELDRENSRRRLDHPLRACPDGDGQCPDVRGTDATHAHAAGPGRLPLGSRTVACVPEAAPAGGGV